MSAALQGRARRWALVVGSCFGLLACGGGGGDGGDASTASSLTDGRARALAVAAPSAVGAATASVITLTKVGETRVGRTVFDYQFKITVLNGGQAQSGVKASLTAAGPGTTVIDGEVQVGDLAAGATVTPADTITLRQDRSLAFNAGLLTWQFSSAGPVPASLKLALGQLVLGAGQSVTIKPTVFDANGQAIVPTPPLSYQVQRPAEGVAGATPTVAGDQLGSAADTRGGFTLVATVAGTAVSGNIAFTVLQNNSQSKNAGQYVKLAAAHGTQAEQLALIAAAVAGGNNAAATAANALLQQASASVDPVAMGFTTPYEPDLGFVPTTAKLTANGVVKTPADTAFGTATGQLRAKLAQISALLKNPGADAAANAALLTQYGNELTVIAATLRAPQSRPGLFGIVEQQPQIDALMARELPALLKTMASRVNAQMAAAGLSSPDKLLGAPRSRGDVVSSVRLPTAAPTATAPPAPQFLLGGLLNALGPIGQLINNIYGDYLNQIENAAILLGTKALLDEFLTQTARINGLKTGGSFAIHAYNLPGSYIDVSGMTLADAQTADVFLVGGAAINALKALGKAIPPPKISNIKELYDYFDGVLTALQDAQQAYDDAHQQPSRVVFDSFDNGGCLPSLNDNCIEMQYDAGFKNVSGGSVSFTVLVLLRNGGARPQYGSMLVNFAPGT